MPYTGPDDEKLPDHVKAKPKDDRRLWVEVWNDSFERCQDEGGAMSKCEGEAFRDANAVIKDNRFIIFKVNQAGAAPTKRITHIDGKEYLVAPTVAIVEGVMNELLYTGEEIDAYIEAWNGKPLVFGHPTGEGGEDDYISANNPNIFAQSPGFFFNASFQNGKLTGEWWIDIAKADTLGGKASELIAKLEAGQLVEQSTGLFTDVEEVSGLFRGEYYIGIARNIRPDHVAILLDEIGACSIDDGCGTPRANSDTSEPVIPPKDGAAIPPSPPVGLIRKADEVVNTTAGLKPININISGTIKDVKEAFQRAFGLYNEDNTETENQNPNKTSEVNMDAEQMKADILAWFAAKGFPFAPEMLEVIAPEQLAQMWDFIQAKMAEYPEPPMDAPPATEANETEPVGTTPPAAVPVAANAGEDEEATSQPAKALALPKDLQDLVSMLSSVGGVSSLKEMINQFKASADEEINNLLSLIAANSNFTKNELKGLSAAHLRKLAANVCQPTADYSGRGAGIQIQGQDDGWTYGWPGKNKEAQ